MDELARRNLEEQRDFLLASLRDLERERQAGDVDDADYHALRSSYTARAADIIRRLDAYYEELYGLPRTIFDLPEAALPNHDAFAEVACRV